MIRSTTPFLACCLLLGCLSNAQQTASDKPALKGEADKPLNVIFILADDLGWSDTTLYGTDLPPEN